MTWIPLHESIEYAGQKGFFPLEFEEGNAAFPISSFIDAIGEYTVQGVEANASDAEKMKVQLEAIKELGLRNLRQWEALQQTLGMEQLQSYQAYQEALKRIKRANSATSERDIAFAALYELISTRSLLLANIAKEHKPALLPTIQRIVSARTVFRTMEMRGEINIDTIRGDIVSLGGGTSYFAEHLAFSHSFSVTQMGGRMVDLVKPRNGRKVTGVDIHPSGSPIRDLVELLETSVEEQLPYVASTATDYLHEREPESLGAVTVMRAAPEILGGASAKAFWELVDSRVKPGGTVIATIGGKYQTRSDLVERIAMMQALYDYGKEKGKAKITHPLDAVRNPHLEWSRNPGSGDIVWVSWVKRKRK